MHIKRLSYYIVMVTFVVVVIEICAYCMLSFLFGFEFSGIENNIEQMVNIDLSYGTNNASQDVLRHPYYGYVHNANGSHAADTGHITAENLGFHGEGEILREYYDDVCSVAILGGSVANMFYGAESTKLKKFFENLPENKGKKVYIFGITNWGYKQPQHMLALLDIIAQGGHFDYVISIDGFNEVAESVGNNMVSGVYPFFPVHWNVATRDSFGSRYADAKAMLRKIGFVQKKIAGEYQAVKVKPFVFRCAFVLSHRLSALCSDRLKGDIAKMQFVMTPGSKLVLNESGSEVVNSATPIAKDVMPWIVLHWARASAMINNVVAMQNGKYFHFLQPNQYVIESKEFTQVERDKFYDESSALKTLVPKFYPFLQRAGSALAREGVSFHDLSYIFKDVEEDVYIDDCCHVNKTGNDIIEREIEKVIVGSLKDGKTKIVNTVALGQGVLEDKELRNVYFENYSSDFDLFTDDSRFTVSGILPQERGMRTERWAVGATHSVAFFSPIRRTMLLDGAFLTVLPGQTVRFTFNGVALPVGEPLRIARDPFDYATQNTVSAMVETRAGWNSLVVDCAKHNPEDRNFSILYTRLSLRAKP